VLLRGGGRLDVFPPADIGVSGRLGRMPSSASSFERVLERFGDRRGYVYFCLLGGALFERGLIHAAP
jgi:3-methyladenine DNA glycosylase/8-oxoguanine DNA glycosylase